MPKTAQAALAIFITSAVLVIDQIIKVEVKTNMMLHESIRITDWFYISFIENKGMAFGMSFIPKTFLSVFRFVASCALIYYIRHTIRKGARTIYVILLSMVLAGAVGNLIDCMFYGLVFSESVAYRAAHLVEFGAGYAPFLEGKVVDMFYFPLIDTFYPDWFPLWGGERFVFFAPVFNFADASISVGTVALLLFCRKELAALGDKQETVQSKQAGTPTS
ncbi:MAG: lipoprotein signal peptidase [Bacteroidaceae bacterium]|nr:lipoprotein signal peptidase [Bacteroidaceae bacterium]